MTVSEKLRLVQGLHSHAEMFGFKWDDDSDWTWHDVACKIADEVDAENAKLHKLVDYMTPIAFYGASERERDRMRELGMEEAWFTGKSWRAME